jgi:release factor glutamine methyltransferase
VGVSPGIAGRPDRSDQVTLLMTTRRDMIQSAVQRLEAAGVEDARRNAEWMLEEALGVNRAALLAHPEAAVATDERKAFEAMLSRRLRREPLQYVVGHADFYGLRLIVNPAVLIPRPETEELVERALDLLKDAPDPWVLDIGTGSGSIALAIKHHRPDAEVFASDVAEDALAVAAANADALGLAVTLIHADALSPAFASGVPPAFDLVVSNPPYVPAGEAAAMQPEVRDHEPHVALFTGEDPLQFYRAISGHAERLLKPGGRVLFETHADHAADVEALLASAGFEGTERRRDMAGRDRMVWASRPG